MRKVYKKFIYHLALMLARLNYIEITRAKLSVYVALQKIAADEAVEYIQKNMSSAQILFFQEEMIDFAVKNISLSGSILEFGVANGKSINYLASRTKKNVYGFDSFEGLPESGSGTYWKKEMFGDLKGRLPKVPSNVILKKGWFNDTIPVFLQENHEDITLIHLDPDIYSSHKTIFLLLGHRIKVGTILIFDDYFDYVGWKEHGFKAFQEFVLENQVKYEYLCWKGGRESGSENGGVVVKIKELTVKK
jgi:hypothetical protein